MKTITKLQQVKTPAQKNKLRVAAYCRVSTGSDAQLESLDTQKTYLKITSTPEATGSLPVFTSMKVSPAQRRKREQPCFSSCRIAKTIKSIWLSQSH